MEIHVAAAGGVLDPDPLGAGDGVEAGRGDGLPQERGLVAGEQVRGRRIERRSCQAARRPVRLVSPPIPTCACIGARHRYRSRISSTPAEDQHRRGTADRQERLLQDDSGDRRREQHAGLAQGGDDGDRRHRHGPDGDPVGAERHGAAASPWPRIVAAGANAAAPRRHSANSGSGSAVDHEQRRGIGGGVARRSARRCRPPPYSRR